MTYISNYRILITFKIEEKYLTMALTKILKYKAFQNLRNWLKYHFPNPGMNPPELKVVESQGQTSNTGET